MWLKSSKEKDRAKIYADHVHNQSEGSSSSFEHKLKSAGSVRQRLSVAALSQEAQEKQRLADEQRDAKSQVKNFLKHLHNKKSGVAEEGLGTQFLSTDDSGLPKDIVELALQSLKKEDLFQVHMHHAYMINPQSRYLMMWDAVVAFFIVVQMFYVPLRMAMPWWHYSTAHNTYSTFVNTLSMIDIALHFRKAVKTPQGIVSDPYTVAKMNLRTWFVIDLLATIPFDAFLPSFRDTHRKSLKVLKYFRIPKLLRVVRLVRVFRNHARYYGLISNWVLFLILLHLATCLWIGTAIDCRYSPETCDTNSIWIVYTTSLRLILGSFFLNDNIQVFEGTGFFSIRNARGHIREEFQVIIMSSMLVGFCLIAMILANVSNLVDSFNGEGQRFQMKVAKFRKEMNYFDIPPQLQQHVLMHYEYLWINRKSFISMSLLKDPEVSNQIRRNISVHLFRPIVERVPFFRQLNSDAFVTHVCINLKLSVFMPGDFVFHHNDPSEFFYIINEGAVCVLSDYDGGRLAVLTRGDFFGEIGLFDGSRRRNSIRALTASEICTLSKAMFNNLREMYPEFESVIAATAKTRVNNNITRRLRAMCAVKRGEKTTAMDFTEVVNWAHANSPKKKVKQVQEEESRESDEEGEEQDNVVDELPDVGERRMSGLDRGDEGSQRKTFLKRAESAEVQDFLKATARLERVSFAAEQISLNPRKFQSVPSLTSLSDLEGVKEVEEDKEPNVDEAK